MGDAPWGTVLLNYYFLRYCQDMRRARITYEGALHHGMNRGYEGRTLFSDDQDNQTFLELLEKVQESTRIQLLAFCLMGNHYHLVLQNLSGRMSEFFKQLNGQYGTYYRQRYGGRGYVFQDRYKSKLIQDEAYLMMVIAYVLNNPVKAAMVRSYDNYPWSSGSMYFKGVDSKSLVDSHYVNELFGSEKELQKWVINAQDIDELPMVKSDMGLIIGGSDFIERAEELSDRRSGAQSIQMRRLEDRSYEPVEKVIQEFERMHGTKLAEIDTRTHAGKKLRTELLVHLKDRAGLRYVDIMQIDLFAGLSLGGLGCNYRSHRIKKIKI